MPGRRTYQPFTIHVADTFHPSHQNHLSIVDGPFQVQGPNPRPRSRMSAATSSASNRSLNAKMNSANKMRAFNSDAIPLPSPIIGAPYTAPAGFDDDIALPIPLNAPYGDPNGIRTITIPIADRPLVSFAPPDAISIAARQSRPYSQVFELAEHYDAYHDTALIPYLPHVEQTNGPTSDAPQGSASAPEAYYADPQEAQPTNIVLKRNRQDDEVEVVIKRRQRAADPEPRPTKRARPARPTVAATEPFAGPSRGNYLSYEKTLGKRGRNGLHGQAKRQKANEVVMEKPKTVARLASSRKARPKQVATQQPSLETVVATQVRGVKRTRNQKDEGVVIIKKPKVIKKRQRRTVAPSDRVTRSQTKRKQAAQVFDAVVIEQPQSSKRKLAPTARQATAARTAEENARIRNELLAYQNGPIKRF